MMRRALLVVLLGGCDAERKVPAVARTPGSTGPDMDSGDIDTQADTAGPLDSEAALVPLPGPRLLRRASLDLRGVLPTVSELDAAESDSGAWRDMAAGYYADARFEGRLTRLLAERWWTRVDVFDIVYQDYNLLPAQETTFERGVGEEPLRIMARVVADDAPWSTVVTADWTMAHHLTASLWPLDYPAGASGWQVARYTDGRPAAGVLSTNGLWWRYTTTESNMNRGRAAAISKLLLCEDPLDRVITFADSDAAAADPEDAVHTDPGCLSCHASVDPLAASLFGFWWLSMYSRVEEQQYHPEREALAEDWIGYEPAWFGEPMTGLADLGAKVASDPRTYTCAVETFAGLLWRRPVEGHDLETVLELRETFLAAEARPQALLTAILDTPEYQAGAVADDPDGAAEARERTARLVSPDQLSTMLQDITGFRWTWNDVPLLDTDATGYRVLAGGVDGLSVTEPQTRPNLPWAIVIERLCWLAADRMVRDALEFGQGHPMLPGVDLSHMPGDPVWETAVARTWWRMTGTRLSTADRDALAELFMAAVAQDGTGLGWRVVNSVNFRDPLVVSY
ncbi:MAG: hypothetical protein VX265_09855 [Myxococcota bacterium]|nr:hypothetical protein [Myxococcota bacterium]